jgi:SsrA-binding protein
MAILVNKKIRLNYEILETIEAGIKLLGNEVRTIRQGNGTLDGAHAIVRGNETFLIGMSLPAYQPANALKNYDKERAKKLLLTKKQIRYLSGFDKQKGLTIVPLSVYNKNNKLKVELGIVRGKKKVDKRKDIKRRDIERDIGRKLKAR